MSDPDDGTDRDTPLSLATLPQIVDELGKRFDCVVLACDGMPGQPEGTVAGEFHYCGNLMRAVGLSVVIRNLLTSEALGAVNGFTGDDA